MKRALATLVAVALLAAGCSREPLPAGLEAVPHPGLDGVEPAAREQLAAVRERLETAQEGWDGDARGLADAYGSAGELYHAYRLLEPAAVAYRNAGRLDPGSFVWPYLLGVAEAERGRFADAEAAFARAGAAAPEHAPLALRLGEIALALGDAAAAAERFAAASGEPALAAAAHHGLGRAAAAADDHAAAVEHFARVRELQPDAGAVRHALGLSLARLGREEEAHEHLASGASGEVTFPDPPVDRLADLARSAGSYLARGNRALVAGDVGAAAELFARAVAADPDNAAARRNLALAQLRAGDAPAAVATLEAALERRPDDVWLHVDLGNARLAQGATEPAVRSFARAVELAPDLATARFNLANALGAAGRWAEALPHLARLVEVDPRDARSRYLEAMALHATGRPDDAAARLRALLAEEPGSALGRDGLVKVLTESGRRPEAEAVYVDALDADLPREERLDVLRRLAELRWALGRREDAIATFRRAVALAPESSRAHTGLANALQVAGRHAEARAGFARAVELDPENATAWLSEATLWILAGEHARARARLEEALAHAGADARLLATLARLLATAPEASVRDGVRAADLARRAYALEPSFENGDTLGMAMAEMGRFDEAIRWQERLVREAAARGDRAAAAPLVQHLRLYEQRRPVRIEPPA